MRWTIWPTLLLPLSVKNRLGINDMDSMGITNDAGAGERCLMHGWFPPNELDDKDGSRSAPHGRRQERNGLTRLSFAKCGWMIHCVTNHCAFWISC